MHRRIKAWIDAKRRSRQSGTSDIREPEMPYLPNPRPYALTPPPSQQQITSLAGISPLFKLPVEFRRKILIHAFGDRTIHIDLVLTHPLRDPSNYPSLRTTLDYRWVSKPHSYPYTIANLGVDKCQSKYWQWRGCVCHRLPPPWLKKDLVDFQNFFKPADDRCCDGFADCCPFWTRYTEKPASCWIGAMGWLLTCRQAYVEGTEILYGTNIIHLSSQPLLNNLTNLIHPRSLSLIMSLEIVWWLDTYENKGKAFPDLQQLDDGLMLLYQHFPRVQSMHLGLRLDIRIVEETKTEIKRSPVHLAGMLHSMDAFVKKLNEMPETDHLREPFVLSIYESAYKALKDEVQDDNQHYVRKTGTRIWRPLIPGPFLQDEQGDIIDARANNGYWVCGDYKDRTIVWNRPLTHWECILN